MKLYPAIDLLEGEVVRLVQGDFALKQVFGVDPAAALEALATAGAEYLHLVDLSGARNPPARQLDLLRRLLGHSRLKVQVGGGVRRLLDIEALLAAGAERVVLGSLVVTEPETAQAALSEFGSHRITLALDVRLLQGRPMVMTQGWATSSGLDLATVLAPFVGRVQRILCTDIAVDGRMVGPNVALYASLCEQFPGLEVQASGGVGKLEDLRALKTTGVHSAVLGRALLTGAFTLAEALYHAQ